MKDEDYCEINLFNHKVTGRAAQIIAIGFLVLIFAAGYVMGVQHVCGH